jgi:hypothetical protein
LTKSRITTSIRAARDAIRLLAVKALRDLITKGNKAIEIMIAVMETSLTLNIMKIHVLKGTPNIIRAEGTATVGLARIPNLLILTHLILLKIMTRAEGIRNGLIAVTTKKSLLTIVNAVGAALLSKTMTSN